MEQDSEKIDVTQESHPHLPHESVANVPKGRQKFDIEGLTEKQKIVLEYVSDRGFLLPVKQLARETGVSRVTIHRWLNHPNFKVFQAKWQELGHKRALNGVPAALDVLLNEMNVGSHPGSRVGAAKVILEYAGKMVHRTESKNLNVESKLDLTKVSEEDLEKIRRILGGGKDDVGGGSDES